MHDIFNLLSVLIFLPINWIYPVFEKMTYEIAKNQKGCDEDSDECTKQEFLKPYIKPYTGGVAKYNKNVAKDVSQGYCAGKCSYSLDGDAMSEISKMVCAEDANGNNDCSAVHVNYESSWMSSGDLYKKRAARIHQDWRHRRCSRHGCLRCLPQRRGLHQRRFRGQRDHRCHPHHRG